MIAAASLPTRARIERPQLSANATQTGLTNWLDVGGVWIALEPAGESPATDALGETSHALWRVRMRSKSASVQVGWRLRVGARVLLVRARHQNVDGLDRLLCEETTP